MDVLSLFKEAGAWALLSVLLLWGGWQLFGKLMAFYTKTTEDHKEFVKEVMEENQKREKRLLDNQAVFGEKMGEIVTCFKSLESKVDGLENKVDGVEAGLQEVKADVRELKAGA